MPGIFTLSATPSSNTTIDGINVAENCPAAGINNAIRSLAAICRQTFSSGLENFLAGTSPLALTSGGTGLSAALTTNALVKQGASAFTASIVSDDGTTATVSGNGYITGNLGLGTATPAWKFDVTTAAGDDGIIVNNSSTAGGRVRLNSSGTGGRAYHIVSTANASGLGGGRFAILDNTASDAVRVAIDPSGNVGIGTANPTALFDITGTARVRGALTLDTALPIAQGGTGAVTAAAARAALSAAISGSNNDITALTALSTAITLAQGGTGATTAAGARTNLGAQAAMTVTTNANGTAFGFTIGATTYYIQCMPVGALGVNGSATLTYPVALSSTVLAAMADKYVAGPINDGLNLGSGAPGLSSMNVTNGGTAMSGGYAIVIGF